MGGSCPRLLRSDVWKGRSAADTDLLGHGFQFGGLNVPTDAVGLREAVPGDSELQLNVAMLTRRVGLGRREPSSRSANR